MVGLRPCLLRNVGILEKVPTVHDKLKMNTLLL